MFILGKVLRGNLHEDKQWGKEMRIPKQKIIERIAVNLTGK